MSIRCDYNLLQRQISSKQPKRNKKEKGKRNAGHWFDVSEGRVSEGELVIGGGVAERVLAGDGAYGEEGAGVGGTADAGRHERGLGDRVRREGLLRPVLLIVGLCT